MKIIDPSFYVVTRLSKEIVYNTIAEAMRNCYRSDLNERVLSDVDCVKKIMKTNHQSVVEHVSITVQITCDRGVTHELVRHRLASYSQESTRYCVYSSGKFGGELTFVRPSFARKCADESTDQRYLDWLGHMAESEAAYFSMLEHGASAQEARAVLPNSLATKIAMTANLREWIHVFRLRCDKPAHPDMRATMIPIMLNFADEYPEIFSETRVWLEEKGALECQ